MADVRELLTRKEVEQNYFSGGLWWGSVTNPVPIVETDPIYVIIPEIDIHTKWGPCKWMPRSMASVINVAETGEPVHNITVSIPVMPIKGSHALVVFDNRQNLWVVAWE